MGTASPPQTNARSNGMEPSRQRREAVTLEMLVRVQPSQCWSQKRLVIDCLVRAVSRVRSPVGPLCPVRLLARIAVFHAAEDGSIPSRGTWGDWA